MSYYEALQAAGANILAFQEFGSYQGDWYAKVEYNGASGWINGGYGSCSGCDAFQAEFDYSGHYHGVQYEGDYIYNLDEAGIVAGCEQCIDYKARLAKFGDGYLAELMTYDEAIKQAMRYSDWDDSANEMVEFINEHK